MVDVNRSEEVNGFLQKLTHTRVAVQVVEIGTPSKAASKQHSNRGHVAIACAHCSLV
jgi:hypothetical protein